MRRFVLLLLTASAGPALADDWPQYLGPKRDGVWREDGILDKFPAGGPKKVWAKPVGGGYAGPAVADGTVFVTDRVQQPAEAERVFAFDAKTGAQLWTYEYPVKYQKIGYASGPRATPTVDGDRVYTLGAMGDLVCLTAAKGEKVWGVNYVKDYSARTPIWGFASAPLVDGDRLLCVVGGKGGKVVVAFDKKTGKELWAAETLDELDCGYSPPVIYTFGKVRTLVVWHGGAVLGLDPDTGKRLWKQDFKTNYALTAPMPMQAGENLFVTAFYEGPMMLKLGGTTPELLWRGKGKSERPEGSDKLHSIMPTPIIKGGHIYGVCSYGELRCLKLDTGERVWETRKPTVGTTAEEGKPVRWGNLFLTQHADRFFLFNEQGELIIARLSPKGYEEIDRAKIVEPTNKLAGRPTVWTPPAFAGKKMYVRNDKELVCVDLAK